MVLYLLLPPLLLELELLLPPLLLLELLPELLELRDDDDDDGEL